MARASGELPTLRERLQEPRILVALGAHDGLTALIAEHAGLEAVYVGGYAVAAHRHGLPDIGLLGLAEMAAAVRAVRSSCRIPALVDADTGYGAEPAVRRAVVELERSGASAVQIEDQVFPKRCGHLEGKDVIPPAEMVLKVKAAAAARNADTVIIARTDSLQVTGLDDAIDRCNLYAEAGADVVFVDAPRTREQLVDIASRVDAPLLVNMSETGRTPAIATAELEAMGYRIVIFPSTQTWVIAKAYLELCHEVVTAGDTRRVRDRMMSFDEVNVLLALEQWMNGPRVADAARSAVGQSAAEAVGTAGDEGAGQDDVAAPRETPAGR
jgi:methylisocitrate lyase